MNVYGSDSSQHLSELANIQMIGNHHEYLIMASIKDETNQWLYMVCRNGYWGYAVWLYYHEIEAINLENLFYAYQKHLEEIENGFHLDIFDHFDGKVIPDHEDIRQYWSSEE